MLRLIFFASVNSVVPSIRVLAIPLINTRPHCHLPACWPAHRLPCEASAPAMSTEEGELLREIAYLAGLVNSASHGRGGGRLGPATQFAAASVRASSRARGRGRGARGRVHGRGGGGRAGGLRTYRGGSRERGTLRPRGSNTCTCLAILPSAVGDMCGQSPAQTGTDAVLIPLPLNAKHRYTLTHARMHVCNHRCRGVCEWPRGTLLADPSVWSCPHAPPARSVRCNPPAAMVPAHSWVPCPWEGFQWSSTPATAVGASTGLNPHRKRTLATGGPP